MERVPEVNVNIVVECKHSRGVAMSGQVQVVFACQGTCEVMFIYPVSQNVFVCLSMIYRIASHTLEQTTLFWIFAFAVSLLLFERSAFFVVQSWIFPGLDQYLE